MIYSQYKVNMQLVIQYLAIYIPAHINGPDSLASYSYKRT